MNDINFVLHSLKFRQLNSFLSVLLTAFSVSLALLITLFGNHIEERINADGEKIDIVVGAKGSPLQLILSSIYHIDIPTGNIPLDVINKLSKDSQIKKAIPLALGDNWKGYRIVGTTTDYIKHYNAQLNYGRYWNKNFEVVVGSSVDLKINDEFIGVHGLVEEGSSHKDEKYKVIGILKPSGTVLDRLILTSVNSVLSIHGLHEINNTVNQNISDHKHEPEHDEHKHESDYDEHKHESDHDEHKHESDHDHDKSKVQNVELGNAEITALLITTKSPIANINLPRKINRESNLQAANPALEINRLSAIFGIGSKSFATFSLILIIISGLSIFSGLASNLDNRMGDLAILRAIGYTKIRIFKIIILEGMLIVICGLLLGIFLGLLGFLTLSKTFTPLVLSGAKIGITLEFFFIIMIVLFAGFIAAIFPAYFGSKISVVKQLSKTI